jgi:hypothetical protein
MLDGELIYYPYADEIRGERLVEVGALIDAHADVAFQTALNVLMRTSQVDDIALNISVYAAAPDPRTGHRQFPRLAFEIVHTEALGYSGRKAAKLCGRGVRVFAIDVDESRVLEWSIELGSWTPIDPALLIEDPALAVPLSIRLLASEFDCLTEVARALLAKGNPVLEEHLARVRAEGRAEGLAEIRAARRAAAHTEGIGEALIMILTTRGLSLDSVLRERILAESDRARLHRWVARAATCATLDEVFAEP